MITASFKIKTSSIKESQNIVCQIVSWNEQSILIARIAVTYDGCQLQNKERKCKEGSQYIDSRIVIWK